MSEQSHEQRTGHDEPAAAATQLTLLLDAATAAIDEEFKRTERLEQKARNQATFTATLYAGAQALLVGLLNGVLTDGVDSSLLPALAIAGIVSTVMAAIAFALSYRAWRLRDESPANMEEIGGERYLEAAMVGNPLVGQNLVIHYRDIAKDRRQVNEKRVKDHRVAAFACATTMLCVAGEIILAFVAVYNVT